MKAEKLRLGMIVYHRDIYQCREPLKVVGIKEDEVELEGDYSGGTFNVVGFLLKEFVVQGIMIIFLNVNIQCILLEMVNILIKIKKLIDY